MEWLIILLIVFTLLLLFYIYTIQFSYKNMPPGPLVFPVIGSVASLFLQNPVFKPQDLINCKAWEHLHFGYKKYGGLFSMSCGKFNAVVIASYDIIKEVENLDDYSMKVSNELTIPRSMGKELGLIFAMTPELWTEMRKFSQRTLRDFGFGKRYSMQSVIEAEIVDIVKEFREEVDKTKGILKIRTNFILSVLNVLWCMIAGQRYAHDDPKLLKMLNRNFAMTKSQTFLDPALLAFPFLRQWFPKFFKVDYVTKVYEESHVYSKSLIDERKDEGAYLQEPQNYIDCFLKKIEETEKDSKSVYTYENLQMMIEDFMQTGSTTTNGTLNYAVLFLTLNPKAQQRCQAEIDSVVPRHMVPTMDDIEKMPYFQATILETHRLANVVPIPIPRISPRDWNLRGFTIPKGAAIVTNHYSVHMDEEYWKDPQNFRPERFINEEGNFVQDKHVVHFGFGKRICIGITLSNSVIPIYIATLLQNFNFGVVPGSEPPTMEPELGVSLSPKEFAVCVTNRP